MMSTRIRWYRRDFKSRGDHSSSLTPASFSRGLAIALPFRVGQWGWPCGMARVWPASDKIDLKNIAGAGTSGAFKARRPHPGIAGNQLAIVHSQAMGVGGAVLELRTFQQLAGGG